MCIDLVLFRFAKSELEPAEQQISNLSNRSLL